MHENLYNWGRNQIITPKSMLGRRGGGVDKIIPQNIEVSNFGEILFLPIRVGIRIMKKVIEQGRQNIRIIFR